MKYSTYFANLMVKYFNKNFGGINSSYFDMIDDMYYDCNHIAWVIKLNQDYDNTKLTIKIRDLYWDFYEARDLYAENLGTEKWNKVCDMMASMDILVRTVRYIANRTCRE